VIEMVMTAKMTAEENVWGVVTSHDSYLDLSRFKEKGGMKIGSARPWSIGFFIPAIPPITTHYRRNVTAVLKHLGGKVKVNSRSVSAGLGRVKGVGQKYGVD